MLVTATWSFEPDTSLIESDKKYFAEVFAKRELDFLIKHGQLDVGDFNFEVIDDNDDHEIED